MRLNKHSFNYPTITFKCKKLLRYSALLGLFISILGCNSVLKEELIYEDGGNVLTTMKVEYEGFTTKAISRARLATNHPIHKFEEDIEVADDYLWTLSSSIGHLPEYQSQVLLFQALYNLALEEGEALIDGSEVFKYSGKKEPLKTADISYSVMLGLGISHPDVSRKSLVEQVFDGVIKQDAQLGGGWPSNVDRAAWIVAAWELYLISGNDNWLRTAFNVASRSMDQDISVVYDVEQNLFRGTPPFTYSIEEVYPEWMKLSDVSEVYAMSTNALYYKALICLTEMAKKLGNGKEARYRILASEIKASINDKFWIPSKGYYSSLLYNQGKNQDLRSNTLANAWAILFDISDDQKSHEIAHKLPVSAIGAPRFYPYLAEPELETSNSIWLVEQAFWNKAIKKTRNHAAYPHGLYSLFRPIALNMTHRDFIAVQNGNPVKSEVNRTKSLPVIASTTGTILQQIFGIEYTEKGIELSPFVPKSLNGEHRILGLRYRNAILNLKLRGYGDQVYAIFLGQRPLAEAIIPTDLEGVFDITVVMTTVEDVTDLGFDESDLLTDSLTYEKIDPLEVLNGRLMSGDFNLVPYASQPKTPSFLAFENQSVVWNVLNPNDIYHLYRNGNKITTTQRPRHIISPYDYSSYQLQISNDQGFFSFLSKPLIELKPNIEQIIEAETLENASQIQTADFGFTGDGYLKLEEVTNSVLNLRLNLQKKTRFQIRFRYANGNKSSAVSDAASYRTLYLNDFRYESIIMPSSDNGSWNDWMYSNPVNVTLPAGSSLLSLQLEPSSDKNRASKNLINFDHIQLIKITE